MLCLLNYNKLLKQRNAFLKIKNKAIDLLEVYDFQMIDLANSIHHARKEFINEFIPIFNQFYQDISSNKELVSLQYISSLISDSMKIYLLKTEKKIN